ncbi:GDYXXLXY domain-containing protein [Brucella melitensis]|uniref:Membrane-anchored protein n=3 Tax=Brucella melitensis TaxID=29459 RepID=C0RIN1_BRUMB|nr:MULTISPECIES: GDYXXLXY domain-containing protein [Brucella]EPZ75719.1 hypothetical protein M798_09810 [Brucella melitensis ADMAS-G1]EXU82984.1 hypothetical protein AX23_09105 [Brucella melitensis 548]AAL52251.1 hypothetical protein BMEI1070 [Brucella melitensis bv. 1 str. 16M]ACO00689.1 Hypothetical protein, conserved [Brucella melitensis ATCC 23457]ADZ65983.1 conserved hypothetical protein [Brucella melitensis M28]
MTTNRKWLYAGAVLAALLQTGILYAGIEKRAAILRSGQDIVFQTEPVDPRDLMRGDYVVLGYEISNIARSAIQGVRPAGSRTVYVAVKPDAKGISRFSRASFVPFKDLATGETQIRGEAGYEISDDPEANIRLSFGIERYYVPEGEGHPIEGSQREHDITVLVAVDASGSPVIKALMDEGQPLYEGPLY